MSFNEIKNPNDNRVKRRLAVTQLLTLLVGIALLIIGLSIFFFQKPATNFNLYYQQPVISNGSIIIVVGIVLLIIWIFTKLNKKKYLDFEIEKEAEEAARAKRNKEKSEFWEKRLNSKFNKKEKKPHK